MRSKVFKEGPKQRSSIIQVDPAGKQIYEMMMKDESEMKKESGEELCSNEIRKQVDSKDQEVELLMLEYTL